MPSPYSSPNPPPRCALRSGLLIRYCLSREEVVPSVPADGIWGRYSCLCNQNRQHSWDTDLCLSCLGSCGQGAPPADHTRGVDAWSIVPSLFVDSTSSVAVTRDIGQLKHRIRMSCQGTNFPTLNASQHDDDPNKRSQGGDLPTLLSGFQAAQILSILCGECA